MACGLRDAIEAVSAAMEEAHDVLSFWEVTNFQPTQVKISGAVWQKIVIKGAKDFHRFGLPVKLGHFINDHELTLFSNLVGHVVSINTVRNFLVHRGGFITAEDVISEETLKLTWRTTSLFIETDNGEIPIKIGETIEEGGMLSIRFSDTEKTFRLGEGSDLPAKIFRKSAGH